MDKQVSRQKHHCETKAPRPKQPGKPSSESKSQPHKKCKSPSTRKRDRERYLKWISKNTNPVARKTSVTVPVVDQKPQHQFLDTENPRSTETVLKPETVDVPKVWI